MFGGAMSVHGGAYIDYVTPGIIIMTVGSGCATTALNVCMDMSEGIITRFSTMAISRTSVLTGQVLGSLIRTMITIVFVILLAPIMWASHTLFLAGLLRGRTLDWGPQARHDHQVPWSLALP